MTRELTRTIARNAVIAATMALAVFASLAVTSARQPTLDIGIIDACDGAAAVAPMDRQCRPGGSAS